MVCIMMLGMWSFWNGLLNMKLEAVGGPGFECFFPEKVLYSPATVVGGGDCLPEPKEWSRW